MEQKDNHFGKIIPPDSHVAWVMQDERMKQSFKKTMSSSILYDEDKTKLSSTLHITR